MLAAAPRPEFKFLEPCRFRGNCRFFRPVFAFLLLGRYFSEGLQHPEKRPHVRSLVIFGMHFFKSPLGEPVLQFRIVQ